MLATQLTRLRFDELAPNHAGHIAFYYRHRARLVAATCRGKFSPVEDAYRQVMFEYTRITIFGGEL